MYAGYENYWMYDNRRHEPQLYFQKNDSNFRHSAYADRYKQAQGKGSSNNVYNYAPHPNTVTTSHQNVPHSDNHHIVTSTQSMLPSLLSLQPYPSSLTCQYLPNEVCSAQPNSVPDSCVPFQNQVLRNVQNYNPGQTVSYKSSAGPVINYKTQTSSIRVKDFSQLNNNSKNNNCNSLLVGDSDQSQQKRPWYYLHDCTDNRSNWTSNDQMQSNSYNYGVSVNYSYQNYDSRASHNYHIINDEQYSPRSAGLYQQNAQYERQVCSQGSEKSNQDFSSSDYPAAQRKNSSRVVTQEADEQKRLDSGRHSDNNAHDCNTFNMSESDKANLTSQAQVVRPEPIQKALQSPSISTSDKLTAKISYQNSNNEVTSFSITVPGTVQSTTNRDNGAEASKNSHFSSTSSNLNNITLKDCAGDGVSDQKEGLDTSEGNWGVSQSHQQEPGCVRNEENQNSRKETVAVCDAENFDEKCENIDENDENIDSILSENSEDNPESVSTAIYDSQQSDVVILDETETCIEPTEDGDEIDPLPVQDKCKSAINRDKLDLLIEFLKEGGKDPVEVLTIAEDDSPPAVTNPLEDTPPKKNRRKLSKTSIVRNKNTEREMISLVSYKTPKNSSVRSSPTEETRTAESSDCSKDNDETVSEDKQPEEEPRDEQPQDSILSEEEGEDRSPTESTCDCPCYGKGITREERTIINIMRAFQNLKSHFCASCAFTSPVEWIWINIVSGELRCLNCFKKMILKAEESHGGNSKKYSANKSKSEGQTAAKETHRREDVKERVEEEHGMRFEKDLKKDGAADKRKRETRSDEVEKPKRTKSTEERVYVKHRKKVGEDDGSRKRSNSTEEVVPRKKPVLEEEVRQNKRDKRVSRSRSRDSSSSRKSTASVDKIKKHESGRPKTPNSTEGQKSHKTKESKAEHESKRKGRDAAEKPPKKIPTEEEIEVKKIRAKHSWEKMTADVERHKTAEKAKKNGEPEERTRSPKNNQEDSNQSEKAVSVPEKTKRRRKRAEMRDPSYIPPRTVSADERKPSKTCKRAGDSQLRKIQKKNHEHSVAKKQEMTKHSCRKTTETPEKVPGGIHDKSSKQCLISKLFKGTQCPKANPSSNKHPQLEEERKGEKETTLNRCQQRSTGSQRTFENTSHKRRHSGEAATQEKGAQHRSGKNGEKVPILPSKEDKIGKSSYIESPLIIRLMQKTTKLSLRLLEET